MTKTLSLSFEVSANFFLTNPFVNNFTWKSRPQKAFTTWKNQKFLTKHNPLLSLTHHIIRNFSSFFVNSSPSSQLPSNSQTQSTHKDKLTIRTWNASGISAPKRLEHTLLLNDNAIDVACITETHLKPKETLYISNFSVYIKDITSSRRGGVALLVRNTLCHKPINTDSSPCNVTGVEISFNSGPVRIFSLYSPPHIRDISEIPNHFNPNTPTIVAGDLNAKKNPGLYNKKYSYRQRRMLPSGT